MADSDPDLSEQYVLSCLPTAGSCNGGTAVDTFKYIRRNTSKGNNVNGIIPEPCFPYMGNDEIPCEDKCENWQEYLIPIQGYSWYYGIDGTKEAIMSYGPVAASMTANDNFSVWGFTNHDENDYFSYEEDININHIIIIVGWKDDPSVGKGGYWICKNSWGDTFGYDGFFNIEYESLGINRLNVYYVEYNPDDVDWFPVARTHGPYYAMTNEPITFYGDAQGEYPPFSYRWDFGDESSSTDQNPTHNYDGPGEYTVQLTVTDKRGLSLSDETFAWIQETNEPPTIVSIEGPSNIKAGKNCCYNVSFTDPDGSALYLYGVAFGKESNIWWGPYPPEWCKESIEYHWPEEGEYTVKCKVKDPYGAESDWTTLEVTVPKNKSNSHTPFLNFLENHPNMFPLLRGLFGLQ